MACAIPLKELMTAPTDWRKVRFWTTHDDRFLSANEMSTEHLINICRQIVNQACEESDIEPVPIKTVRAYIDFDYMTPFEWVTLCRLFVTEIELRMRLNHLPQESNTPSLLPVATREQALVYGSVSGAYRHIYEQVCDRIRRLSRKMLTTGE